MSHGDSQPISRTRRSAWTLSTALAAVTAGTAFATAPFLLYICLLELVIGGAIARSGGVSGTAAVRWRVVIR